MGQNGYKDHSLVLKKLTREAEMGIAAHSDSTTSLELGSEHGGGQTEAIRPGSLKRETAEYSKMEGQMVSVDIDPGTKE